MDTFIIKKRTGLGSDLMSIVGSIYYAYRIGCKTVMIDWTNSIYTEDNNCNMFNELFNIEKEILGVQIITGKILLHNSNTWNKRIIYEYILNGKLIPVSTFIMIHPMHIFPDKNIQKKILSSIVPKPCILEKIEEVVDQKQLKSRMGIHIRHGKGKNLLANRNLFIKKGIDFIYKQCSKYIGDNKVYLSTDSYELEQYFLQYNDNVEYHFKKIRNKGGAVDAVVDMWALSYCKSLLYNESWFSQYARILGNFEQQPVNVDPFFSRVQYKSY